MDIHEQIKLIRERNKRIRDRNRKIHKIREHYLKDLEIAREKYGWYIPFGFNLENENVIEYLEYKRRK